MKNNKYFDEAYILYGIKLDANFSALTIPVLKTTLEKLQFKLRDTMYDNVFCYSSATFTDDVTTIILYNGKGVVQKVRYIEANLETLDNKKAQSPLLVILKERP